MTRQKRDGPVSHAQVAALIASEVAGAEMELPEPPVTACREQLFEYAALRALIGVADAGPTLDRVACAYMERWG